MKNRFKYIKPGAFSILATFCLAGIPAAFCLASAVPADLASQPRVFITDSNSWEMSGGFGGSSAGFGGAVRGGARPQTAEIIKTFGEKCPQVTVTMNKDAADFVVLLDHEGGKGLARKKDKVAVFQRNGDSIFSHSTRSIGNAVKDSCKAIMAHPVTARAADPAPAAPASSGNPLSAAQALESGKSSVPNGLATVDVKSTPDGADITVDGKFVGSTPSSVTISPGDHAILVEKSGFKSWQRTTSVNPGSEITINVKLEKTP
jgi:PEGA domain